jgi:hypothetical protein
MKKISLLLVLGVSLILSSCSGEDSSLPNDQNSKLLKTFKVKKDATGAYSVDFNVSDNTKVDEVFNVQDYTLQYFLYPTRMKTENNISEDLVINDNQIKIGFVDTQNDNSPMVTIKDDIKFANKSGVLAKLKSYDLVSNEDGTFDLNFRVKNKTNVSFSYNEEINTYEVHLEDGKGGETKFSRNFAKEEGQLLKIDFVTHFNTTVAKNAELSSIRKPVIIIDDGEDSFY